MQHQFEALTRNFRLNKIEKVQRMTAPWSCRRWLNINSVDAIIELEWPSLQATGICGTLYFFFMIHCEAVSDEKKNKNVTAALSSKSYKVITV